MPQIYMRAVPALLLLLGSTLLFGQTRSPYFDQEAEIVLPQGYDESQRYPAIVFLPYTTGTAEAQARAFGVPPGEQEEFIVILPAGRFQRSDYLPNFLQFVEWYEKRLLQELNRALRTTSVDPGRIYLAGYSLGGDLGWALSARNPDLFAGAVMAGTRASYPLGADARRRLLQRGYRSAFIIGNREIPERANGIERAHAELDNEGIAALFRSYDGAHELPPRSLMLEALAYVTSSERVADWSREVQERAHSSAAAGSGAQRAAQGSGGAGSETVGARLLSGLATAVTREPTQNFGIRYQPGFEIAADGFRGSAPHAGQLRAEGLFDDIYLMGRTTLDSRPVSGSYRLNSLRQEVAVAYGRGAMWGGGFGWDWYRWMRSTNSDADQSAQAAITQFNLSAFWIHPRRMQGIPASVLQLRYQIPRALDPFIWQNVFNAELRYHLHVTDWIQLQAGLGSRVEQNRPYQAVDQMRTGLDHVLAWQAGIGFRIPGPLRWEVMHAGRRAAPLGGTSQGYSGSWRVAVEYLF